MNKKKQYPLGINVLYEFHGDEITAQIGEIARVGFDGIFTHWEPDHTEKWANAASKNNLFYQSIHAPFSHACNVSRMWREGEEGVQVANTLIECVKDCARHDIPVMVIHPFIGFKDHTPTQVGLDNYARVIEAASKFGVMLGFENVEGEEYLAALMEKFWNEPSCGFCLDTGHEQCYNGGKDMLALYGEKLCHTHFNDNLGVLDKTLPIELSWKNDLHLTMGDGIVDWKGVMDRIDATPYQGPLICELTRTNKLGRPDHDKYAAMTIDEYYAFALNRARKVLNREL